MRFSASMFAGAAVATLVLATGALAPLTARAAAPPLQNGGFESNLDDWTADDSFVAITNIFSHRDGSGAVDRGDDGVAILPPYEPLEGDFFAVLSGGDQFAAPDTNLITLNQTFHTDGGLFSGFAAFLSGDYMPYDDFAFVRITPVGGVAHTLFASHVGVFPQGYGQTGWTAFSHYLDAGDYLLEAGIANVGDDLQSSFLLLDDFKVTAAAVPEPTTWAMMLTGFFGLGVMLRQRRLARARR